MVVKFIKDLGERGEVVIPFIESVSEGQRPAVASFITNAGATTEDIAGYKSFDEFLSGYKPKVPSSDWTSTLEPDHKTVVGVKGWKTPADAIKGYSELEKLVGHEKIAMPKKDKDGNYEKGEFERVMSQLGLPKDSKEYKESVNFKLPEGVKLDEKFSAEFKAEAHKVGLLPHQYAFVMDKLASVLQQGMQAQKESNEKAYNESILNLRSKWGSTYDAKSKIANDVLKNFVDPKLGADIIKKYGNDPALIELLANVGGNLSEESLLKSGMSGSLLSPEAAKAEKNNILTDSSHPGNKAYFNAEHPQHQYWVDKVYELNKLIG